MRVIIKDKFYEFQNDRTEELFAQQKKYLTEIVAKGEEAGDVEGLMTNLLSLYNLTEALIYRVVDNKGVDTVVKELKATEVL